MSWFWRSASMCVPGLMRVFGLTSYFTVAGPGAARNADASLASDRVDGAPAPGPRTATGRAGVTDSPLGAVWPVTRNGFCWHSLLGPQAPRPDGRARYAQRARERGRLIDKINRLN